MKRHLTESDLDAIDEAVAKYEKELVEIADYLRATAAGLLIPERTENHINRWHAAARCRNAADRLAKRSK